MRYGMCLLALLVAVAGCKLTHHENLPPAEMIMHPGPGVDGPGPGVMVYSPPPPAAIAASQVAFVGPEGVAITWDVSAPGMFDSPPLIAPGRYNFPQNAIYRLKLTNVPARPGIELYPTLEIGPTLPRTSAFLAHNAIPVQFTEEDLEQVLTGNFVTKVIYLPDPPYQELALAGVETLVSTRLDPGVDPIIEADRRGAILAIVRLGNKDLQLPGQAMMQGPGDMVVPAAYGGGPGGPAGPAPANYVAGVTVPQYGMPISGTPIGLPGPPHVPLGVPAGLQKHTIKNHTHVDIPHPTSQVKVHVRQYPGISYPKPANHVYITEKQMPPLLKYNQPPEIKHQAIVPQAPCDAYGAPNNGIVNGNGVVNGNGIMINGTGMMNNGSQADAYGPQP